MPIRVGSLLIEDKDSNNQFDPKIDQIKNEKGKVLRLDSMEVKKTLSDLGLPSFNGFRLSEAGRFQDHLREATIESYMGHPEIVKDEIKKVKEIAAAMHLPFSEDKAKEMVVRAYEIGVRESIREAEGFAEAGEVEKVTKALARARDLSSKLESLYAVKSGFSEKAAQEILQSCFLSLAERGFKSAENYAEMGGDCRFLEKVESPDSPSIGKVVVSLLIGQPIDWNLFLTGKHEEMITLDRIDMVDRELAKARVYSIMAGVSFDEGRAEEIRTKAYVKEIETTLDAAELYHLDRKDLLEEDLKRIRECSEEGGIPLDEERVGLLERYLSLEEEMRAKDPLTYLDGESVEEAKSLMRDTIGVQRRLREAVAEGRVEETERLFGIAQDDADKLRWKFSIQLKDTTSLYDLLDEAMSTRLEKDMQDAEREAGYGNVDEAQKALDQAYDHSLEFGLEYDEVRADGILVKAYESRLENAYQRAASHALFGNEKGCLKSLREAEGYAKELSIPFDSKRAEAIKKSISKTPPVFPVGTPGFLGGAAGRISPFAPLRGAGMPFTGGSVVDPLLTLPQKKAVK